MKDLGGQELSYSLHPSPTKGHLWKQPIQFLSHAQVQTWTAMSQVIYILLGPLQLQPHYFPPESYG